MNRWQIFLIVAIAALAWMAYKRFIKKEPLRKEWYQPPQPEVENWFAEAQKKIEDLDEQLLTERLAGWESLNDKEQKEFSDEFILNRFGQKAITGYNVKQRLELGKAYYLTKTDQ